MSKLGQAAGLGLMLAITCHATAQSANDHGYVRRAGGTLNGQLIDATHYTIAVAPGERITGSISVQTTNLMGSNAVAPLGWTVDWGAREAQPRLTNGWIPTGTNTYTINIDVIAPTGPGERHIIVAFCGEFTIAQVMSATNWPCGDAVWYDGNDAGFDWSPAQFQDAINSGVVQTPYRGCPGPVYNTAWLPATAIVVQVGAADPPGWPHWNLDSSNTRCFPQSSRRPSALAHLREAWTAPGNQVVTGDVNGDGRLEIACIADASLTVYDVSGTPLWTAGLPYTINNVVLDDLDGNGHPDVVICGRGSTSAYHVRAYRGSDGQPLKTIPVDVAGDESVSLCGVYDLRGDGHLEVVLERSSGYELRRRGLWVYDYDAASELWGYCIGPGTSDRDVIVADINGDGQLELLMGSSAVHNGCYSCNGFDDCSSWLFCFRHNGTLLWATQLNDWVTAASLADIDGDGVKELLVFQGGEFYSTHHRAAYELRGTDGTILQTWNGPAGKGLYSRAVGNLRTDAGLEIVLCGTWPTQGTDEIDIVSSDFRLLTSRPLGSSHNRAWVIADVDGDGQNEVYVSEGATLWALDGTLNSLRSWTYPQNVSDAIVSDVDADGMLELLIAADNNVHVYHFPRAGDMNCDGGISYADINPFVAALGGPAAYAAQYPGCNYLNGDLDRDGVVSYADIRPFVALLAHR